MSDRSPATGLRLVADIGGTWARVALAAAGGALRDVRRFACARYSGPGEAIADYLKQVEARPLIGAIAVAAPVEDDEIALTNSPWRFSREGLRGALGLTRLEVLNDLEALARSIPALQVGDLETLHGGRPTRRGDPALVLGVGTGLGVASLVPFAGGWRALAGEGGHRDLAATSDLEWRVVEVLARRFGRASAERALSGPGLVNLLQAVDLLQGAENGRVASSEAPPEPAEVSRAAVAGDPPSRIATDLFSGWLGAVAGDAALTVGARGGVYLAGEMLRAMGAAFHRELFVERFLSKGRFRSLLTTVPVGLIVHPHPTLLGAALTLGDGGE